MPAITVLGLLLEGDKVLLARRAGLWQPPGGPLAGDDEDADYALLRELEPTLGIAVREFQFGDTVYGEEPAKGGRYIHNLYLVHRWEGEPRIPATGEYAEVGWFDAQAVTALPMAEALRRAVLSFMSYYQEETAREQLCS